MDLVTQAALGAVVAEAALGRRLGARAALLGAGLGLLPDADALLRPLLDDLGDLTWHRSLTHSALFCLAAPPLLGAALARWGPRGVSPANGEPEPVLARSWALVVGVILLTHVLLDCCTTWGTQVGWPLTNAPVAFCSVSVIDPLATLPLLVGLALALRWSRERPSRRWVSLCGAGWALGYLLALGGLKLHMERLWRAELTGRGVEAQRVFSKPTLGNGLLWRLVADDGESYWVGYRSLLDSAAGVEIVRRVPRRDELLPARPTPRLERLLQVCGGWVALDRPEPGSLVVQDLRYGQWAAWTRDETPYVFAYRVTLEGPTRIEVLPRIKVSEELRRSYLRRIRGAR
ncbi:MAG TPA: hypothetical protein DEA08_01425 [Planctomycetes bacterium]|nr:hypothetical protein [Planctomycetota bacterium]